MKVKKGFKSIALLLLAVLLLTSLIFPAFTYGEDNNRYFAAIRTINGKYFFAKDGEGIINATKDKAGEWETFEIVDLGKGNIALRSSNGFYLRVEKDGSSLYADSREIGRREIFELKVQKNKRVAFKTFDNKYISAENGGGAKVRADVDEIGIWETFELVRAEETKFDKSVLTARADGKGISFSWNPPSNTKDLIGYNLYRGTRSGGQSETPITDFPIEGTSYTDYNVKENITYYYILKAVYKDNILGTESNEVSIRLNPYMNLGGMSRDEGIYLYWDKVNDNKEIVGYYLYRSTRSGGQTNTPITDFPIEGLTYLDKNIRDDTSYYYTMRPVYKDKTLGPSSNEVAIRSNVKTTTIVLQVGSKYMEVNGQRQEIDPARDTSVALINGRTFLPIRAVIEALGGQVDWRESDQRIIINYKGSQIELWIGQNNAKVNKVTKETDVAPYISSTGRTMLPLRFIMENIDSDVDWDGLTKKITIRTSSKG